ncbi:MAG: hypothetical protein II969_14030 [Anaerolineaceae bacterium]|nr:hypothetical protein [Anaerolineaceae bacterium]
MRHATTNYRAIKKLIDSGDKSVRTACYQEWDGGFAYYLYKDRDRFPHRVCHLGCGGE